jgi:hypothetical protein
MKTQRLTFKIVHGHASVCLTMYFTPDFYSLIPSFELSFRSHALFIQSHHKDGSDPGEKEYLNGSKICQKGAIGSNQAFPLK